MGSSGNGMFGTYRGGGAGSIVRGGNNGGDECPLAIENILCPVLKRLLEICQYLITI